MTPPYVTWLLHLLLYSFMCVMQWPDVARPVGGRDSDHVDMRDGKRQRLLPPLQGSGGVLQSIAACCSVLQRVAACCSVLQRVAACCSVL